MKENGFEYVDMGFKSGIMWATCNVGATKPEDPGLLFQFGRVDGYRYWDENNKFRTEEQNMEDTYDRDINQTTTGNTYNPGDTLGLEDDAAHVNMGGAWRMPTKDEIDELVNNTTHTIETLSGVKGMMFTSIFNYCQVFIPFGGWWYNGNFYGIGDVGNMWSSQVHDYYIFRAHRLWCESNGEYDVIDFFRTFAYSIRGVFNR